MHRTLGHAPANCHAPHRVPGLLVSLLLVCSALIKCSQSAMDMSQLSEINLLQSLHLHNTTFAGLQQKPGPHSPTPAAFFSGSSRAVYYSSNARDSITSLIQSSKEFSFLTSIRQNRQNTGTIFAFSYGKYQTNRYLEIQSSGRQDVLRVHYSPIATSWTPGQPGPPDQDVRVESFPLRLADDSWHRLAVIVSGDQIEVLLDCRSVHRRVVPPIDTSFLLPDQTAREEGNLTLWLGQRNQGNFLFKGYLQETRMVAGHHGYLVQCPNSDSSCPTCGQFKQLEDTVSQLQQYIKELNSRLSKAEEKISELEDCECSKSCMLPSKGIKRHHEQWTNGCDNCTCNGGEVECAPIICPDVKCSKPDPPPPGGCCSTCRASCEPLDKLTPFLTHGEVFVPKRCHSCECNDGHVECSRVDPEKDCPELSCPSNQRIVEEGKCCPICREFDFCSRGHDCHPRAECKNGIFNYSCHCNQGFQGNGTHCDDIDECKSVGGPHGHHCTLEHGRCINLEGGYTCDCELGFQMDATNTTCLPVNLCDTHQHKCHQNASCIYSGPGSHNCECSLGFSGDGYNCEPVCDVPCHNGGKCIAPSVCGCAPGYSGTNCQEDINECLLGEDVHKCLGDSICVNRVGWFYCACKRGYKSYHNPLDKTTSCTDVDECEASTHTCHESALCLNTLGSYSCYCGERAHQQCSTDCVLDGKDFLDGSSWTDGCNRCNCDAGRVTCSQLSCDCSVPGTDRGCCPECYDKRTCLHQDIPGLKYRSGEKWAYQCMECECLHGEVDCWPQDCPPQSCNHPVRKPGACCPSCPGQDSCGDSGKNSSCVHGGLIHQEGDSWQLEYSDCTSCQCKAPFCDSLRSKADNLSNRMGMFFAILSLHVAWVTYFMKIPTGNSSSSILKPYPQSKMQPKPLSNQNQNRPKNTILSSQLQKFHNLTYLLKKSQYPKVNTIQLQLFTVKRLQHQQIKIVLIDSNQDTKQRMQSILGISNFKKGAKNMLERLIQLRPRLLLLVMNLSKDIFLLMMVQKTILKQVKKRSLVLRNTNLAADRTLKCRVVAHLVRWNNDTIVTHNVLSQKSSETDLYIQIE